MGQTEHKTEPFFLNRQFRRHSGRQLSWLRVRCQRPALRQFLREWGGDQSKAQTEAWNNLEFWKAL